MSSSSLASSDGTLPANSASYIVMSKEFLPYDKCPRCKTQFDFIKRANSSKVPLILKCKHTVCEECIRRMCTTNLTVCPVCKERFTVARNEVDKLSEIFQPHFTLIGHLVWTKNSVTKKLMNWVTTGTTLRHRHSRSADSDIDGKSENSEEEFDTKLQPCFTFSKCLDHPDQSVSVLCEDCNDVNCCFCFLEKHSGHKSKYLHKLDQDDVLQLSKLRLELEVVLSHLLNSRKKVKELSSLDTKPVDLEIKSYFMELHAKLHLAEHNIRKKLAAMEAEETDVEVISESLTAGIGRINQLLRHFELLNTQQLNLRALLDEALELRDLPCRLVSDQGSLRPISFNSEFAFDDIEDKIFLESYAGLEYNLLPVEDWDAVQEKIEIANIKKYTSQESIDRHAEASTAARIIQRHLREPKKQNEFHKIRAVVTHINSVDSFYVQFCSAADSLQQMNACIAMKGRKRLNASEYKIGEMYAVAYEIKNVCHWRRGKVLDVVKKNNIYQFKVFFVDYGNTHLVTADKLKELYKGTLNRTPFAFECKLTNPEQMEFDENAHLRLPKLIDKKELYIRFMDTDRPSTVREIDVLIPASTGALVSVRELLSSTNFTPTLDRQISSVAQFRLFSNSKEFVVGKEEDVIVTYIRDPSYICVQSAHNALIMNRMRDEMAKYYSTKSNMPCIPVENTDVVVNYKDEHFGKWHRARVTSVLVCEKEAEVYFVDWGKTVVVPWTRLHMLTENFIKVEIQILVEMIKKSVE